ncbi:alpha/beta hydrolase [Acetobacter sp. AN02]|uniref:alpha/beta hydrolase n=1 Tax=Acetobacter sp. AN02 TaxID=2894186 RepID=UPI0024340CFD|nr:alpha/beta fold hydrolase [Acetobacter sp. AN02]MDG6094660.1 alpha/beta hydrolase [Acetobacter sp. AN02]
MSSNHKTDKSPRIRSVWRRRLLPGLCIALGLAGCAREPVVRVPPRYATDARLVPPDLTLSMSDGAIIPVRIWKPEGAPRAVILAIHGFNDSRDAWEFAADTFANAGIEIISPDVRGFGGTQTRGRWAGEARLLADLRQEAAYVKMVSPGLPFFLMGESMGGALLMRLVASPGAPDTSGTILLAPAAWNPGAGADISLRILASLRPGGLVTGRELPVRVRASDSKEALIRLWLDPLTLRTTRLDTLQGLVSLMQGAVESAPHVRGPVLLIYGSQDQLIPETAILSLLRKAPSGLRFDLIPGGHHLLLRDRGRASVAADIVSWITNPGNFLPSGGDIAAAAWIARDPANQGVFFLVPSRLDGLAAGSSLR